MWFSKNHPGEDSDDEDEQIVEVEEDVEDPMGMEDLDELFN